MKKIKYNDLGKRLSTSYFLFLVSFFFVSDTTLIWGADATEDNQNLQSEVELNSAFKKRKQELIKWFTWPILIKDKKKFTEKLSKETISLPLSSAQKKSNSAIPNSKKSAPLSWLKSKKKSLDMKKRSALSFSESLLPAILEKFKKKSEKLLQDKDSNAKKDKKFSLYTTKLPSQSIDKIEEIDIEAYMVRHETNDLYRSITEQELLKLITNLKQLVDQQAQLYQELLRDYMDKKKDQWYKKVYDDYLEIIMDFAKPNEETLRHALRSFKGAKNKEAYGTSLKILITKGISLEILKLAMDTLPREGNWQPTFNALVEKFDGKGVDNLPLKDEIIIKALNTKNETMLTLLLKHPKIKVTDRIRKAVINQNRVIKNRKIPPKILQLLGINAQQVQKAKPKINQMREMSPSSVLSRGVEPSVLNYGLHFTDSTAMPNLSTLEEDENNNAPNPPKQINFNSSLIKAINQENAAKIATLLATYKDKKPLLSLALFTTIACKIKKQPAILKIDEITTLLKGYIAQEKPQVDQDIVSLALHTKNKNLALQVLSYYSLPEGEITKKYAEWLVTLPLPSFRIFLTSKSKELAVNRLLLQEAMKKKIDQNHTKEDAIKRLQMILLLYKQQDLQFEDFTFIIGSRNSTLLALAAPRLPKNKQKNALDFLIKGEKNAQSEAGKKLKKGKGLSQDEMIAFLAEKWESVPTQEQFDQVIAKGYMQTIVSFVKHAKGSLTCNETTKAKIKRYYASKDPHRNLPIEKIFKDHPSLRNAFLREQEGPWVYYKKTIRGFAVTIFFSSVLFVFREPLCAKFKKLKKKKSKKDNKNVQKKEGETELLKKKKNLENEKKSLKKPKNKN